MTTEEIAAIKAAPSLEGIETILESFKQHEPSVCTLQSRRMVGLVSVFAGTMQSVSRQPSRVFHGRRIVILQSRHRTRRRLR